MRTPIMMKTMRMAMINMTKKNMSICIIYTPLEYFISELLIAGVI